MNRVLLINPPGTNMGQAASVPLGLLYLAGTLHQNNIPVRVIDGCLFGYAGIQKELEQYSPAIIGIACPTYGRVKALKVAEMARKSLPGSLIVFGGAHPTIMYKQLLENYSFIDIAVIGEGEYTFLEICKGKNLKEIKGICYRANNSVVANQERDVIRDLDALPFPAWHLIDLNKYAPGGEGIYRGINLETTPRIPVIFSRGCIGNCNFCCNRLMWKRWRHRSAKNMADEIEFLSRNFKVRRILFTDDLLTASKKATLELCNEILSRELNIVFDAVTRTDCVDWEILTALKKAGCYKIIYGIESVSPKILQQMGKPVDVEKTKKAVKLTKQAGIKTVTLFIVGNKGENRETINETIDFLNEIRPDDFALANGLMLFPGTILYEDARKLKVIDDNFWLSDYNWKIYTYENSKLKLNVFCSAINRRKKLSRFKLTNMIYHHRFYSRAIEDKVKLILSEMGLRKRKVRPGKYKVAY